MKKKLEGEAFAEAKKKIDEKHSKFFERQKEIENLLNAAADQPITIEAHYVSSSDVPQSIREAMSSEQELYLISIGVLKEPIAPSAGLISV
jgi:hypothetical protein